MVTPSGAMMQTYPDGQPQPSLAAILAVAAPALVAPPARTVAVAAVARTAHSLPLISVPPLVTNVSGDVLPRHWRLDGAQARRSFRSPRAGSATDTFAVLRQGWSQVDGGMLSICCRPGDDRRRVGTGGAMWWWSGCLARWS